MVNSNINRRSQAILVVSFGTTYVETLTKTIESIENRMQKAFPEFEVRRAFTSRKVIKRLAERDGLFIDTEQEALKRLQDEGFKEVYVQPLHVIPGEEYEKVKTQVAHYKHRKAFEKISIGRPLLYYMGQEGKPDDYLIAIEALRKQLPQMGEDTAVLLMGHGGLHPANAAYALLQMKMEEMNWLKSYVYTVEGFPPLRFVIEKLIKEEIKKVLLVPFMLVAGDHALNDMIGDEEDSAKQQLIKEGFEVSWHLCGLGEGPEIQDVYIQHLKDVMGDSSVNS